MVLRGCSVSCPANLHLQGQAGVADAGHPGMQLQDVIHPGRGLELQGGLDYGAVEVAVLGYAIDAEPQVAEILRLGHFQSNPNRLH